MFVMITSSLTFFIGVDDGDDAVEVVAAVDNNNDDDAVVVEVLVAFVEVDIVVEDTDNNHLVAMHSVEVEDMELHTVDIALAFVGVELVGQVKLMAAFEDNFADFAAAAVNLVSILHAHKSYVEN